MSRAVKRIIVVARRNDPETSHQAAFAFSKDQKKASRSVTTAVAILEAHGPLSDFQIRALWPNFWEGPFSDSLPCKARHWAREQGLVKHIGYADHHGRTVRTWGIGRDPNLDAETEIRPWKGTDFEKEYLRLQDEIESLRTRLTQKGEP